MKISDILTTALIIVVVLSGIGLSGYFIYLNIFTALDYLQIKRELMRYWVFALLVIVPLGIAMRYFDRKGK